MKAKANRCSLTREERRQRVLELNQSGKSGHDIVKELGINKRTVHDDLKFLSEQGHKVNVFRPSNQVQREKWIRVIRAILDEALPYFKSEGVKPSLRTVYYRLRSITDSEGHHLLENIDTEYDGLKTCTKKARLKDTGSNGQLLYPVLPIDCFADETRKLIPNYKDNPALVPKDPTKYIEERIQDLKDSLAWYEGKGTEGGRWYKQPQYVEVWIEKFANAPTFQKWLDDKDVNIVVNKGYTSISFLWENIKRLKEMVKKFGVKNVHVLYFGDFDPSGEDMVESLKEYFKRFRLSPNIIRKVALTQKQIDDYDITLEPVKKKDTRFESFEAEHGDQGAEIDAFIADAPKDLKRIMLDSVDEYFDQKIYDDMITEFKTRTPVDELKEIHSRFMDKINEAFCSHFWERDIQSDLDDLYQELEDEEEQEKQDKELEEDIEEQKKLLKDSEDKSEGKKDE